MLGIEVTAVAAASVIVSASLQRKLVDQNENRRRQAAIKEKTKELTKLAEGKSDESALAAKQKEITGLLSETMRAQMKPMFAVLPISLAIYYLVLPSVFPAALTISLFSMNLNYKTYFIIVAFVLGLVISTSLMAYDNARIGRRARIAQRETRQADPVR